MGDEMLLILTHLRGLAVWVWTDSSSYHSYIWTQSQDSA